MEVSVLNERARILYAFGAGADAVDELLAYNRRIAVGGARTGPPVLPLPDEPCVDAWAGYAEEADHEGVFAALRARLVQLRFPIAAGQSQTAAYQAATRRGTDPGPRPADGLVLAQPDDLELFLHPTPAGHIPVVVARHRGDFVALVQALTRRNEPVPLPDAMGALMVSGYNNWDRIRQLRADWARANPGAGVAAWQRVFKSLIPQKERYQDRFILLSDGPYSAVAAEAVGMDGAAWRAASLTIRREHEATHYFTRRVFGSMENNLIDELAADYMGIRAAHGRFRADWFLRFMGLEAYPAFRESGRFRNYRGTPPLSDDAFAVQQALLVEAAAHLERFDAGLPPAPDDLAEKARLITTVARLTLEEIAAPDGTDQLRRAYDLYPSVYP